MANCTNDVFPNLSNSKFLEEKNIERKVLCRDSEQFAIILNASKVFETATKIHLSYQMHTKFLAVEFILKQCKEDFVEEMSED